MTRKELKQLIESDVYRHFGGRKRTLYEKLFMPQVTFLKIYRKAKYYRNRSILSPIYKVMLLHYMLKYHFQIGIQAEIGKGFRIDHYGKVIINPNVKIGDNCTIAIGVTIGQELRGKRKGCPTIGNDVWIGTNSVIVGKITIGNNVMIAPNTFVNFNVPDNTIVIGNPAKIIHKENATDGYIVNPVK